MYVVFNFDGKINTDSDIYYSLTIMRFQQHFQHFQW